MNLSRLPRTGALSPCRALGVILILVAGLVCPAVSWSADAAQGDLHKYMKPQVVTELDWKLLDVQFSLASVKHWDDFGLISSVSVWRIPESEIVGVVFSINDDAYAKATADQLNKAFDSAVHTVYEIARADLPELHPDKDIHAAFVVVDMSKTVGEFVNGKLTVAK